MALGTDTSEIDSRPPVSRHKSRSLRLERKNTNCLHAHQYTRNTRSHVHITRNLRTNRPPCLRKTTISPDQFNPQGVLDLPGSMNPPRVFQQTHYHTKLTVPKLRCLVCTEPELTPSVTPQPCETSPLDGKATRSVSKGPREPEDAGNEHKRRRQRARKRARRRRRGTATS